MVKWNWQHSTWPDFKFDAVQLQKAAHLYSEQRGLTIGTLSPFNKEDDRDLFIDLITDEAMDTSFIEGEVLDRKSIQSSIKKALGLKVTDKSLPKRESGIADMLMNMYQQVHLPLNHTMLYTWHGMIMRGQNSVTKVGGYRDHEDPMQIVSGISYAPKVHFEAPPSHHVKKEMEALLHYFKKTTLHPIIAAGLAHIWFESIHPFEDGNGRVGRAISQKLLSVKYEGNAPFISLSSLLLQNRKAYYAELEEASQSLDITRWLMWFALMVLNAQRYTLGMVKFIAEKHKLLHQSENIMSQRQQKVMLRLFKEGLNGFKGGLSTSNYMTITGAPSATANRDLNDLVTKNLLKRTGQLKGTRYHLPIKNKLPDYLRMEDIISL